MADPAPITRTRTISDERARCQTCQRPLAQGPGAQERAEQHAANWRHHVIVTATRTTTLTPASDQ